MMSPKENGAPARAPPAPAPALAPAPAPAPASGSATSQAAENVDRGEGSSTGSGNGTGRQRSLSWSSQAAANTLRSLADGAANSQGASARKGQASRARTSSHNGRDDNSAQERSPTSSSHAWSPLTNNDRPHSQGGESERAAASASDVKPARSSIGAGGQSAHPNSPVTPSSARNGETRSGTGADGVAENSSSSLRPESSDGREGLVSSGRRNSTDPAVKEKHAGNGDEGGRSSSGKGSSKRKKASRACFHCQKAHLTCDDSRPCQRCVRKGLADTCTDGLRKKAKYLLDEAEIRQLRKKKEEDTDGLDQLGSSSEPVLVDSTDSVAPMQTFSSIRPDQLFTPAPAESSSSQDPMFNLTFDPMYSFGSEATSLEYSILSSMLNGTDPTLLAHTPEYDQTSAAIPVNSLQSYENSATTNSGWSSTNAGFTSQPGYSSSTGAAQQSDADNASSSYTKTPSASAALDGTPGIASADLVSGGNPAYSPLDNFPATPVMNMQSGTQTTPTGARIAAPGGFQALEIPSPSPQKIVIDNEQQQAQQQQTEVKFEQQSPSRRLLDQPPTENIGQVTEYAAGGAREDNSAQNTNTNGAAAAASAAQALSAAQRPDQAWAERVAKVYKDRTRPFPYTEGYHFLIKHVTKNFEKNDVLRIVRALAIFRPSLIALQMPLTEEDEVFVERSFQRTILEFEKLISFSGTPTVVWRRTCEICVVGAEFSMLTQWSRDDLVGKHIYQFLDKNSTVEYWEKFALHAFENTAQSVLTTCVLMTPSGKPVPCSFCFTIKRDVFDLPSLIVGNFLPILS